MISSFTVVQQAVEEKFKTQVPYVVALIELEEGPQIMSVIVDCPPDAVGVGQRVAAAFQRWGGADMRVVFRLIDAKKS